MKKLVLSIVIALTMLTGCVVFPKKNPPTITAKIAVAPELLLGCAKLQPLSMQEPQYEDIAQGYLTVISQYGQCALKQEASIAAIKQLANLEQSK